jgi:hypothetical protein
MERKLKRINNIIFEHERYASNNYITLSDDDYKKEYTAEVWETLGE